jgi:hypothetical protein
MACLLVPVIAQSLAGDCFVAALLAMTGRTRTRVAQTNPSDINLGPPPWRNNSQGGRKVRCRAGGGVPGW